MQLGVTILNAVKILPEAAKSLKNQTINGERQIALQAAGMNTNDLTSPRKLFFIDLIKNSEKHLCSVNKISWYSIFII